MINRCVTQHLFEEKLAVFTEFKVKKNRGRHRRQDHRILFTHTSTHLTTSPHNNLSTSTAPTNRSVPELSMEDKKLPPSFIANDDPKPHLRRPRLPLHRRSHQAMPPLSREGPHGRLFLLRHGML